MTIKDQRVMPYYDNPAQSMQRPSPQNEQTFASLRFIILCSLILLAAHDAVEIFASVIFNECVTLRQGCGSVQIIFKLL